MRCLTRRSVSRTCAGSLSSGTDASSSRASSPSRTPCSPSRPAPARSSCRTTAAASSTTHRSRSNCSRRSCARDRVGSGDLPRHRDHAWVGHRRCAHRRRELRVRRPRLPARPDGGWPPRSRPRDRNPRGPDRSHDAPPRSRLPRRARTRASRTPGGATPGVALAARCSPTWPSSACTDDSQAMVRPDATSGRRADQYSGVSGPSGRASSSETPAS